MTPAPSSVTDATFPPLVPELTGSAGIQLNNGISLQRHAEWLSRCTGNIPLGGFVSIKGNGGGPFNGVIEIAPQIAASLVENAGVAVDDLAKRLDELQRLRRQVHELEQRLAAIDCRRAGRSTRIS